MPLEGWIDWAAAAGIITVVGALVGIVLRDYIFSRSLERWKQRRNLEHVYQRFHDPLLLSARELASRCWEITHNYPPTYVSSDVLDLRPNKQIENTIDDDYYRRYKLLSTVYRFTAFFGWLELYRREVTFLRPSSGKHGRALEATIERIRSDFADGQLNTAHDWQD